MALISAALILGGLALIADGKVELGVASMASFYLLIYFAKDMNK